MPPSCLSVVRVAAPQDPQVEALKDPSQLLTERLVEHFAKTSAPNSSDSDTNPTILQVSNRYFSAAVALLPTSASSPNDNDDDDLPHKEDGIILTFYDHAGVQDLTQLLNTVHEQAGDGDLVRLCVGLSSPDLPARPTPQTPKELEEEYSQRVLWCLDRGYEYVPACDLSPTAVQTGHDQRDKEGFARVVEALQGTVWSSAVMAAQRKEQLQASYQETVAAVQNCDDDDDAANAYEPPNPADFAPIQTAADDAEREQKAKEALLQGVDESTATTTANTASNSSNSNMITKEDLESERLFGQFEGAIKEASRIRDLSRSGDLSDEERRQRAGDAAMMLVNLLDQMGYDDDEDDDEGKGDDSSDDEEES